GGLAGTGLTSDDDHLVVADGSGDVVPALADRQFRRVADGRAGERGRPGRGALRGPGVRSPGLRDRVRRNFVHQRERLDDGYRLVPTLYAAVSFPEDRSDGTDRGSTSPPRCQPGGRARRGL